MLSEFIEATQTTKGLVSISGITFFSGVAAALIDIIPVLTAIIGLILGVYTLISSRKRNKNNERRAQSAERREQERHEIEMDNLKRGKK